MGTFSMRQKFPTPLNLTQLCTIIEEMNTPVMNAEVYYRNPCKRKQNSFKMDLFDELGNYASHTCKCIRDAHYPIDFNV